jgi:glycerol-3-phosphate dehydrogenase
MGTSALPVEDPDRYAIERQEVEMLARRGAELVPCLSEARVLRAWAGVRPLYHPSGPVESRQVTRHHTVIDHARRDGVSRFVTIVGGKFTTYRRMAEETVDLICEKFQAMRPCQTAETPLAFERERRQFALGGRLAALDSGRVEGSLVCECEIVARPQLETALEESPSNVLSDLRRDLRLGMGPCQGTFCAARAAAILREVRDLPIEEANTALLDLLQARWKGLRPVAWGHTLRQIALALQLHRNVLAADRLPRVGETEPYPSEMTS